MFFLNVTYFTRRLLCKRIWQRHNSLFIFFTATEKQATLFVHHFLLECCFFCAVLHTDIFITGDFTSLHAVSGVHMLMHYMLDNYCSVSHMLIYLWRPATHTHRPLPSGPASHTHERDFSTIFSNFQTLLVAFFMKDTY